MPGAADLVAALQARGPVGIVSNAQFYTPFVLATLLPELHIDPRLAVWSFAQREAKPSPRLFRTAAARMALNYRFEPSEIVMVGNDVRNDLLGARAAGIRTALFAGDARSLRLRRDDHALRRRTPRPGADPPVTTTRRPAPRRPTPGHRRGSAHMAATSPAQDAAVAIATWFRHSCRQVRLSAPNGDDCTPPASATWVARGAGRPDYGAHSATARRTTD